MAKNESNGTNDAPTKLSANANRDAALLRFCFELWTWGRKLKRPITRAELRRKFISRRDTDKLKQLGILKPSGDGFLLDDDFIGKIRRNS